MKYFLPVLYLATIATGVLTLLMPQKSDLLEVIVSTCVVACAGVILGYGIAVNIRILKLQKVPSLLEVLRRGLPLVGVFVVFLIAVYMPYVRRQHSNRIIEPRIAGAVVRKYRSDNHQYPSVEIRQESGEILRLEGIEETAWTLLKPGMEVSKEAWNSKANVDGITVQLID